MLLQFMYANIKHNQADLMRQLIFEIKTFTIVLSHVMRFVYFVMRTRSRALPFILRISHAIMRYAVKVFHRTTCACRCLKLTVEDTIVVLHKGPHALDQIYHKFPLCAPFVRPKRNLLFLVLAYQFSVCEFFKHLFKARALFR